MSGLDEALSNLQNVYNANKGLRYFFMNKDTVLATFSITGDGLDEKMFRCLLC